MALISDVMDYRVSEGYKSGEYTDWNADDTEIVLEEGKEPSITGSLSTAYAAADALLLQYYEEEDEAAAAFGKKLTTEDWEKIADIYSANVALRYINRPVAVNGAHVMLQEILKELDAPDRRFSFLCGHDSNIATILGALGITDYELSGTLEKKAPIGCKLLLERWLGDDGREYGRLRLVYPSTEQLRKTLPLTVEEPPMSCVLELPGAAANEDGYYLMDDIYRALRDAVNAYDDLYVEYAEEELDAAA